MTPESVVLFFVSLLSPYVINALKGDTFTGKLGLWFAFVASAGIALVTMFVTGAFTGQDLLADPNLVVLKVGSFFALTQLAYRQFVKVETE